MGCSSMDTMSVMPATPEPSARWSCLNPTMRAYAKVLSSRTTTRLLTGTPAASARLYSCAIARPSSSVAAAYPGGNLGELVPAIVGEGLEPASAQSHLAPFRSLGSMPSAC